MARHQRPNNILHDTDRQSIIKYKGVVMFNVNSINNDRVVNGSWAEFQGGKFLIAHTSNISFQREFQRLQHPYRKQINRGTLDPKISNEIMCKAMAHSLLLDWNNVNSDNQPLPYSKDAAYAVLLQNEELREFVQEYSLNLDNFRKEEIQEAGKS